MVVRAQSTPVPAGRAQWRKVFRMDVADGIKEILAKEIFVEIPVEEMRDDDSLRDVFGLDSLGFVELRTQAQSRFGIQIPEAEFTPENFATIHSVDALVRRLLARSAASAAADRG